MNDALRGQEDFIFFNENEKSEREKEVENEHAGMDGIDLRVAT